MSEPAIIRANGRRGGEGAGAPKVEGYDFHNPVFLSEVDLRRLRLLHEEFVRYLAARLSLFLRMDFGLKLAKLTTATYAKFTESLPAPSHLCLFKAGPLPGVGILDLSPRLALAMADRLLGGQGQAAKAERPLTEIEIGLLEDVIMILLQEWGGQWKSDAELQPQILGYENQGRFLQSSPADAVVLALTLEVSFGACAEPIQIGVPYYMIEPMVKKIQARRQKDAVAAPAEKTGATWSGAFDHVTIPVRAEWDGFETTLRELANLRVGDVLELPESLLQNTRVLLNGTPKFVGSIGLDTDFVAVQITRRLPAA